MSTAIPSDSSLVGLLGESRARLIELLRSAPQSVAALAKSLGLSEVAVRHHLQVLESDGFVSAQTVRRPGRGRPGSRYTLTDKAQRLFPDNSAELANELLDFLGDEHGRSELQRFLRWRAERHAGRYASALEGAADASERVERLAQVLSDDGFASSSQAVTTPDGATVLELRQDHCAIKAVAEQHPELCAYEASIFKNLVGGKLSRRQTIAGGADACVCHITPASQSDDIGATSQ
jgi:predicted ArsR family transcriptional regulator